MKNLYIEMKDNKYFLVKKESLPYPINKTMALINKFDEKDKIDLQKVLRFASSRLIGRFEVEKENQDLIFKTDSKTNTQNNKFEIHISDDKLFATINIFELPITKEDIIKALSNLKITFGIDFEAIEKIISSKKLMKDIVIARGIQPINGKDGYIEMFVKKPSKKPTVDKDGKVNFYEIDLIKNVQKGDIIARKHSHTNGKDGINLFSEKIEAKPGKPVKFNLGKGIEIVGDRAIAEFDGCVVWKNDIPSVEEIFLVKGDVDLSIGNIEVQSHVHIKGWVRSGFKVIAKKDIQIDGGVEDSTVKSVEGNVFVNLGIVGKEDCYIKAKKDIRSKFIHNANVIAEGNIIANEYIMNSFVKAGKHIIVNGKRGELINTNIEAKAGIMINYLKSMNKSNKIKIEGINRKEIFKQIQELQSKMKGIEVNMREMTIRIRSMAKKVESKSSLVPYINEFKSLKDIYNTYKDEIDSLKLLLRKTKGEGMVKITKNSSYLKAEIKNKIINLIPTTTGIEFYYDPDKDEVIKND